MQGYLHPSSSSRCSHKSCGFPELILPSLHTSFWFSLEESQPMSHPLSLGLGWSWPCPSDAGRSHDSGSTNQQIPPLLLAIVIGSEIIRFQVAPSKVFSRPTTATGKVGVFSSRVCGCGAAGHSRVIRRCQRVGGCYLKATQGKPSRELETDYWRPLEPWMQSTRK